MSSSFTYDLVHLPQGLSRFGDVSIPGSKSSTLRALLLSAQSSETTRIQNVLRSNDTAVMLEALEHLGASIAFIDATNITISGPMIHPTEESEINLGESGLLLRLLLVHVSLFGKAPVRFHGQGRLLERPLAGLINALSLLGVSITQEPKSISVIPCSLPSRPIEISIDPSISSQWISALALSLAHHPFGGIIHFTKPIISKSYLDLTSYWLKIFGCMQSVESNQWKIPGGLSSPGSCLIEGDWSSAAAFILASATQGIPLCIKGLNKNTPQGDQFLLEIFLSSFVIHRWRESNLHIEGKINGGIYEDLSSCPDLAPVLAAACVLGPQSSHLKGLQTLKDKESDRFQKIQDLIHWLGGTYETKYDSEIIIHPRISEKKPLVAFDPSGDHRIAFAAALGALKTGGPILNPTCVNKTFPDFWVEWSKMLGQVT
jgi:3-phosphoshikimate 1-carboxyvinyltransferase